MKQIRNIYASAAAALAALVGTNCQAEVDPSREMIFMWNEGGRSYFSGTKPEWYRDSRYPDKPRAVILQGGVVVDDTADGDQADAALSAITRRAEILAERAELERRTRELLTKVRQEQLLRAKHAVLYALTLARPAEQPGILYGAVEDWRKLQEHAVREDDLETAALILAERRYLVTMLLGFTLDEKSSEMAAGMADEVAADGRRIARLSDEKKAGEGNTGTPD
jgi:hypothetical protein